MDINERKKIKRELREIELRSRTIFDRAPFAIALARMPEGLIIEVNDAFLKLFEYTREEVIGKTIVELGFSDPESSARLLAELQKRGAVHDFEVTRRTKSGARRDLSISIDWVIIGVEKYFLTTIKDIKTHKRMEEDFRKYRDELELRFQERTAELEKLNEELRREIEKRKNFEADLRLKGERILQEQNRRKYLSNELIETLERERQEMAATLHDEVGQILTTINMDLDFVKQLSSEHADTLVDEIEKVQDRIGNSMDYISDLSRDLRPHILDDLGLVPSLKNMFHNIEERSHIGCHLFTKDIPEQLSDKKAVAVYRIVQEAVRNCLRHAQAKNIFVNLTKRSHFILLTIEDDGIGFEYDNVSVEKGGRDKLGLMIMNERAVQAGGEFHIESRPGNGTQVIAEIPIE